MKKYPNHLIVLSLSVLFLAGGCSLVNKNKEAVKSRKDTLLMKKKQHDQLYSELIQKAIKPGTSAADIKEKFGEPDDIFKSGSASGSFDIWTYSKMLVSADEQADWDAILLYFNNDRLITWKY